MSGTAAYVAGVANAFTKFDTVRMTIEFGDESLSDDYMMAGITNGRFSGGGFDGTPQARIDDGQLDITLVKSVSRRFFIALVKSYHDGTHVDEPKLVGVYSHYQSKNVVIKPEGKVTMAIDGETTEVGSVRYEIKEKSIDIVVPDGVVI